jgi:hypothetical protein
MFMCLAVCEDSPNTRRTFRHVKLFQRGSNGFIELLTIDLHEGVNVLDDRIHRQSRVFEHRRT